MMHEIVYAVFLSKRVVGWFNGWVIDDMHEIVYAVF